MRGATQCAARLNQLLRGLRAKLGKVTHPATGDPITQMILGIFSRNLPESKAREALDCLRGMVVDYNELRVIPPIELAEMVGDIPDARLKCEDLSRALNRVFGLEHEITLERARGFSRKDVVEYLEKIDGLEAYSRARVRLLGLNQHALPLDEAMWAYARREGIIDPKCTLDDAQNFLERRIPEGDAVEVMALLQTQAWAEMGAAVREGAVERIVSVPPDRTTRNLLQIVAAGRDLGEVDELPDLDVIDDPGAALSGLDVEKADLPLEIGDEEGLPAEGGADEAGGARSGKRKKSGKKPKAKKPVAVEKKAATVAKREGGDKKAKKSAAKETPARTGKGAKKTKTA